MTWKGKLAITLVCVFIAVASFKAGAYIGVIAGYDYGAKMGARSQDAKIKAFCDSHHNIFWGEQRYRCVPGVSL